MQCDGVENKLPRAPGRRASSVPRLSEDIHEGFISSSNWLLKLRHPRTRVSGNSSIGRASEHIQFILFPSKGRRLRRGGRSCIRSQSESVKLAALCCFHTLHKTRLELFLLFSNLNSKVPLFSTKGPSDMFRT